MTINFLKAGNGDCILIQHEGQNIVVDGGNDPKYLLAEVSKIREAEQCIDLLIITHHDDDHIKGILDLLSSIQEQEYKANFIKEIIFNSVGVIHHELNAVNTQELSFKQAADTEDIVKKLGYVHRKATDQSAPKTFGNLTLTFLSPTEEDLKVYESRSGEYLASDFKCDWNSSIADLSPFIDDKSQDTTIPNRTSIVLLVECENKRLLLTGDVTPSRLEEVLNKIAKATGEEQIQFDYVKLPHHCSYRSLSKNIIEKLDCKKFIISTNSKKYYLPNKRGIIKILQHLKRGDEEIEFYFNYEEALLNLSITTQETKKYRFKLIKNNKINGVSI